MFCCINEPILTTPQWKAKGLQSNHKGGKRKYNFLFSNQPMLIYLGGRGGGCQIAITAASPRKRIFVFFPFFYKGTPNRKYLIDTVIKKPSVCFCV